MTNRKARHLAYWRGMRMGPSGANAEAAAYWQQREYMGNPDAPMGTRMPTRFAHDADNEVPAPFTYE